MSDDRVGPCEFDCTECGRHIISFFGPSLGDGLCAACLIHPGWWRNPELARLLGPVNPPEHER